MHVVIAGGTGFLGRALARRLDKDGHRVTILTRGTRPLPPDSAAIHAVPWNPDSTTAPWAETCDGADAIVNLAGAPIADRRWSPARRIELRDSRILATQSIARAVARARYPPAVVLSASAVGFYGNRHDEQLDEQSSRGVGFLADLAEQWETAAAPMANSATRLIVLRTGLVLDAMEGALGKMLPAYRLGVGGPMGDGRQWMPWIHVTDWVNLAIWSLTAPVSGPVNGVAPQPVTNEVFAKTLGRVLRRPVLLRIPRFVLQAALGEMAEALLLGGQRVIPAAATRAGFTFSYSNLEPALRDLLDHRPR